MSLRRTPVAAMCGFAVAAALAGCTNGSTTASTATLPSAPATSAPATGLAAGAASASAAADDADSAAVTAIGKALSGLGAKATTGGGTVALPDRSKVVSAKRLGGMAIVLDPGHNGANAANPSRLNAPVPAGGFTKPCNTVGAETNAGYPEHAY